MDIWPAPAKLNLFLHVVGRRPDGYHLLQTAFQFLDFGDELAFRITDDGRIARTRELPGVAAAADLTLRAACALKEATGCSRGAEITLTKRLPAGGGLGGGSSDAATTLIALNHLWGTGMSASDLAALGLGLGADVPVFVQGRAAWAEGVGEQLTPLELPQPSYLVLIPPVQVPTTEIFGEFARQRGLTPYTSPRTIRDLREGRTVNELEPVTRSRYPQVERCFELLDAHLPESSRAGRPRMTGTGGCVFAELIDVDAGQRLLAALPQGFSGFVARGMNRHPLYVD